MPALLVPYLSNDLVLATRDAIWNLPESSTIDKHGIQHSLYIGLGAVPNEFGIEWNDAHGLKAARKVDPNVAYVSKEYYNILGQEYFRLVMQNPVEIVRIYTAKFELLLRSKIGGNFWGGITVFWAAIFFIIPVISIISYEVLKRPLNGSFHQDVAFIVFAILVLLYLAQGTIIHPALQYYAPLQILFVPLAIYSAWRLSNLLNMPSAPATNQLISSNNSDAANKLEVDNAARMRV